MAVLETKVWPSQYEPYDLPKLWAGRGLRSWETTMFFTYFCILKLVFYYYIWAIFLQDMKVSPDVVTIGAVLDAPATQRNATDFEKEVWLFFCELNLFVICSTIFTAFHLFPLGLNFFFYQMFRQNQWRSGPRGAKREPPGQKP